MTTTKYFIIDFDSTFTRVEALDLLAEISLKDHPEKQDRLDAIKEITDKGMDGEMSFRESLEKRIALLDAQREHLPVLVDALKEKVSESFARNTSFINKHKNEIYIVSNGFKDFIEPIVTEYGILASNIFANDFEYDEEGAIVSFNKDNILSRNNGKPAQIEALQLEGEVFVLGDGVTDSEIKEAGFANKFYAFTENVRREKILSKADHEAPTLEEFLFAEKLERAHSYPKNRIKVLLLENVHSNAVERFKKEGYQVQVNTSGMDEDELCEAIKDVSILCIRSKTQVTKNILANASRLLAVGAFCIGTNQIDLTQCLQKGVVVFNAPFSNTRSVVELAIAEIIFLLRNLPDKMVDMHAGKWSKSATNSFEVRGKTLGIVGYGKIGSQLSILAEAMGMQVKYFDLSEQLGLGNAVACESLEELLECSDVVSLHVDGRQENLNMFSEKEFNCMRDGAVLLNLSRGHIVDVEALTKALESGKLGGASVDVFPSEPLNNQEPFESPLKGLRNTILTPHIGGSTLEAQENIADFVPSRILEYINTGSTSTSVNFPSITLPALRNAHRFIHIHANKPGIIAEINKILANHSINIVGQYLKTNEQIGYVITDIDKSYPQKVVNDLKKIKHTIRFRVLY